MESIKMKDKGQMESIKMKGRGYRDVSQSVSLNICNNTGTRLSVSMGERIREAFNKLNYTYTGTGI